MKMARVAKATASGLGMHRAARSRNRGRLLIVSYHGLRRDDDPVRHWLLVPLRRFGAQLRYLRTNYTCLDLEEAVERLAAGTLPDHPACITFDDGYRSTGTIGAPVLKALGLRATVYLPTGLMGQGRNLWTRELEYRLRGARPEPLDLSFLDMGWRDMRTAERRREVALQAVEKLKRYPPEARDTVFAELDDRLGTSPVAIPAAFDLMDWDGARRLEATGLFRFGAHTVHHEILRPLDDRRLAREIRESIRCTEQEMRRPSPTFAYPNGRSSDFDRRAMSILADAGVAAAVTTIPGLNDGATDRYALRRIEVGSETTLSDFRLRTAGLLVGGGDA